MILFLAILLVTNVQTLFILAGKVSDAALVLWSQTLDQLRSLYHSLAELSKGHDITAETFVSP